MPRDPLHTRRAAVYRISNAMLHGDSSNGVMRFARPEKSVRRHVMPFAS